MTERIREIEGKWNSLWERDGLHNADRIDGKPKIFCTFPFPYMSGPLHLGNAYTLSKIDTYARFKRAQGFNVLFPFAWHWTGVTVAGISERIKRGDEKTIHILTEVDRVPLDIVEKFKDPVYLARYYTERSKTALKEFALCVDWTREFFTSGYNEGFSKFVSWQYLKLRDRGYLKRGEHPVVWCPSCKSATGDHDRLEGEGVSPEKFVLVKFILDGKKLVAATFRPETIYGVTNVWVNPSATYDELQVNDEVWIVSDRTEEKLKDQKFRTHLIRKFEGRELLGKLVKAPISEIVVPVLPAEFVDPMLGTGVVYSVPEHAPYDYVALKELKGLPERLREYGLDPKLVAGIDSISIIKTSRFGDEPSRYVDSLGIVSQTDSRLEDVTSEVYKEEFMRGTMKENTGSLAGLPVRDAKEKVAAALLEKGEGAELLDLPTPVVCRCGTRAHVKILPDQYLLSYSDQAWKNLAKESLSKMRIFPDEARVSFESTIDWYNDWAFVRTFGLGTKLPWDQSYLIETLSDSTIYMAYYIIAKYVNDDRLRPSQMTPSFFDHVFLGIGSAESVANEIDISVALLEQIKKDFDYWYPVDLRVSGKDLIANHLTFYIFHHTAIFPEDRWPKGISVNGFLKIEGQPMHKSKGIFISLEQALQEYGADATKLTCLLLADGLDDPDWRRDRAVDSLKAVQSLLDYSGTIPELVGSEVGHAERWLHSRLNGHIKSVTDLMETITLRKATAEALFDIRNDLRWYLRRVERPNQKTLAIFFDRWIKMLAPIIPHIAEELWHRSGNDSYVIEANWPVYDEASVDLFAENSEEYLKRFIEDVRNVLVILPISPKKLHVYTCADWKRKASVSIINRLAGGESQSSIVKSIIETDSEDRKVIDRKMRARFVTQAIKDMIDLPKWAKQLIISEPRFDEFKFMKDSQVFLQKELGLEIAVYREEDADKYDPKGKATSTDPLKPAFFIE